MGTGQLSTINAVIANGQSLSAAINLGSERLSFIQMPSAWTAASLSFQVSWDGETWVDLYDDAAGEVVVQAAASRALRLPLADWLGVQRLRVRSGTAGAPVNQAAERVLRLVKVP